MKHCNFLDNDATWGGAIEHQNGTLSVENGTIFHNLAIWGGGIALWVNSALTIVNSHVNFNHASENGGGILLFGPFSSLTLRRTDVTNNTPNDIGRYTTDTTTNTSTTALHVER